MTHAFKSNLLKKKKKNLRYNDLANFHMSDNQRSVMFDYFVEEYL